MSWRPFSAPGWVALLLLSLAMAGCIGAGDGGTAGGEPEPASQDAPETFEPQEHTLEVTFYLHRSGEPALTSGNMEENNWEVAIPANATLVRVSAAWEPSTPLAREQALMLHNGTREAPGDMIVEPALGTSPLETAWATIPEGEETLVVMCHVYSNERQPVGLELMQETRLTVEFR